MHDTRPTEPPEWDIPEQCPVCKRDNANEEGDPLCSDDPAFCSEHCLRHYSDGCYALVNVVSADYVGDEIDGCYVSVGQGPDGWYNSVLVDCDSAGFVDSLYIDAGPSATEPEALQAGRDAASDWCIENSVSID